MKGQKLTSSLCFRLGLFLPVIRIFRSLTDSHSDTEHLALLIDERDDILDHLEMAETRYIASFRTSTPTSSIADFELQPTGTSSGIPARPEISRPMPLAGSRAVRNLSSYQNFLSDPLTRLPTLALAPAGADNGIVTRHMPHLLSLRPPS